MYIAHFIHQDLWLTCQFCRYSVFALGGQLQRLGSAYHTELQCDFVYDITESSLQDYIRQILRVPQI